MPEPILTPAEEQLLFDAELVHTITQWAHVEEALFCVLYECINTVDFYTLSAGFFSIENFRAKLQYTDATFKHLTRQADDVKAWGISARQGEEQFVVRCGRASVHMAAVWREQGQTALLAEATAMIDELLWRAAKLGLIEPAAAAMEAGYGYGNDDIAQRSTKTANAP